MKRKILSIILALLLMTSLNTMVFAYAADGAGDGNSSAAASTTASESETDDDIDDIDDIDDDDEDVSEEDEENDQEEDQVSEMADDLEDQMEELEDLLDEIEDQIEDAIEAGNTALAAELQAELEACKASMESILEQYKEAVQARRELIKARYTADEISAIENAVNNIKVEDHGVTILGFDSVFSNVADFKFDTPPIIKDGRTLVPIRAVTEGFGADVNYKDSTRTVTITKDGVTISFAVGSNDATVNGSAVSLDTQADITNNRTYVPLRFVLEALKLDVQWDAKTRTIEIDDPAAAPATTTPAAI